MAASDRPPRNPQDVYMRLEFHSFLDGISEATKNDMMILEPKEYEFIMSIVKQIVAIDLPIPAHNRYLMRYNLKIVGIRERLYMPRAIVGYPKIDRYFARTDEVFDILYDIHRSTKHSSEPIMERIIDSKYVNITHEMITSFVTLCRICQRNKQTAKMRNTLKEMFKEQMMRRGEVQLLDLRKYHDDKYRFLVCYRDNATQFMLIRAIKSACVEDVAHVLLDFFAIFGAPSVLQSPFGLSFIRDIVMAIKKVWPHLKMVYSDMITTEITTNATKTRYDIIDDFIGIWFKNHKDTNMYQAVRYAQMVVNMAPASIPTTTSYEEMFTRKMKFGISSEIRQLMPDYIQTQKDLASFIDTWRPQEFVASDFVRNFI